MNTNIPTHEILDHFHIRHEVLPDGALKLACPRCKCGQITIAAATDREFNRWACSKGCHWQFYFDSIIGLVHMVTGHHPRLIASSINELGVNDWSGGGLQVLNQFFARSKR